MTAMTTRSGQALVPVLFVVMILTALAVTMAASTKRETKAASNNLVDAQQYMIARGAMSYAAAELQQATSNGVTVPQLTQAPDTDANGWTALGDGWYKLDLVDTSSRININTVDAATLNKLPAFQNDPNLAPSLIDWRDADDTPTSVSQGGTGAESSYYQSLSVPYTAKNGPFDTVDELLLVQGFTPQLLYGPTGQPGALDQEFTTTVISRSRAARSRQTPGGTGGGAQAQPIDLSGSTIPMAELFTTYSKEANYADDGTKRINIRTASSNTIQSTLTTAGVPTATARQIANRLAGTGQGQGPGQGQGQGQATREQQQITALADIVAGKRNPGGVAPLVTPWDKTALALAADKLTVSDDDFLNGRININTAPPEVLATIPGMDQPLLSLIQSQQQAGGFTSINDLFQGNTFNQAQLGVLFGRVCVRSSVYLARVRVRMPGSPRVYAVQALVELPSPGAANGATTGGATGGSGASGAAGQQAGGTTTSTDPKILQWREVPRRPGWSGWTSVINYGNGGAKPLTTGGTVGSP